MAPNISVVIPAYNEERLLPALLASLAVARARHPKGEAAVEIIVADNASTDATATIAARSGCRVAPVEKRAIAAARNGGAKIALGSVLAFIDADSIAHPDLFIAIEAALADPKVGMGASGLRFDRASTGIAFVTAALTPLVRLAGIDGGAVFMQRADFEGVGGYDENLLAAEDVDLLWKVKRRCRTRGLRFRRLQGVETVTSSRKFERHGDWHFLLLAPRLAWQMMFNRREYERAARKYWYEDR